MVHSRFFPRLLKLISKKFNVPLFLNQAARAAQTFEDNYEYVIDKHSMLVLFNIFDTLL